MPRMHVIQGCYVTVTAEIHLALICSQKKSKIHQSFAEKARNEILFLKRIKQGIRKGLHIQCILKSPVYIPVSL